METAKRDAIRRIVLSVLAAVPAAASAEYDVFKPLASGEVRDVGSGVYHFRAATNMSLYVSNHDHSDSRGVFVPVLGVTNAVLRGSGAKFVFHGSGIGLLMMDTRNVRVEGISFDWARPMFSEGDVVETKDGRTRVKFDGSSFPMRLDGEGRLMSVGEGWEEPQRLVHAFSADGMALGGKWTSGKAQSGADGSWWLDYAVPEGTSYIMIRNGYRPCPGVVLYRADDTVLQDVSVHSAFGMAMIAQRCSNVTLRGSGKAADRTCGVFPAEGRKTALAADATHFSNCRGRVLVENCFFRGTVDDAINVHATCLSIEEVQGADKVRCRYVHGQSFGFETFLPGERMTFIHGPAMQNGPWREVESVQWISPKEILVTVKGGVPAGFGRGDAVENADFQPEVVFRNNIVECLFARGALLTTSGRVVVEDNIFDRLWSQALMFSGDVQEWYESGSCSDVTIRGNVFRAMPHNPRTKAVIVVAPQVKAPAKQTKPYHAGFKMWGNRFEGCLKPETHGMTAPAPGAALVPKPRSVEERGGLFRGDALAAAEDVRDDGIPPEGYVLDVSASGVKITSSGAAGAFYARETLKQLAVADSDGKAAFLCARIEDSPAYPWRGVLIDDCRHFFGKACVKKMIEAMAFHKLNTLHWHLTEDQGWRLGLNRWPELAGWGAARSETARRGTHNIGDGIPYGPYFYTEEDIAEIVDFAEAHHVNIVPEIEIPGHSRAALAAFPQYSCLGDRLARRPDTSWGVKRELYCAGNDEAIAFLEGVLDEVCRLFKNSGTIHIGGDECPKTRWRECPKCQARMKALGLRDEEELQAWITRHFTEYLAAKGRHAVGWDEILAGGVPKGTIVMSWRGTAGALAAASNGMETVVCPTVFTYLDQQQALQDDPWRQGGGGLSLSKVYGFDPAKGIPEEQRRFVLGSEGLLWSESIETPDELMWQGFPRLSAIAEILWTADPGRSYAEFSERMRTHIPRLRAMGVNSAPTPEGIPANRAMEILPKFEPGCDAYFDWYARHAYIRAEQPTWRSRPKVAFIGDSVFHIWAGADSIGEIDDSLALPRWKDMLGGLPAINMGCGFDRTPNILWRLDNGELKGCRPELVVLMAGLGNFISTERFAATSPEDTAQAVRAIVGRIRKLQPDADILVMGALPAGEADSPLRGLISRYNALLARIPSYGYGGKVKYLDAGRRFLGAGGEIPRALMPDLFHPSDEGYAIIARELEPYLAPLREKSRSEGVW